MSLWELVKELEEKSQESHRDYAESKATMIVNFGENGKAVPGLFNDDDRLLVMIIKVIEYYQKKQGK